MTDQEKAKVIIEQVCAFYQCQPVELMKSSHRRNMVVPRQVIFYFLREYTRLSLEDIGERFGRCHATVLYGHRTVNNLIEWNGYRNEIMRIRNKIEYALRTDSIEWVNHIGSLITNYNTVEI